uniref:Nitrilase n=1 Tax=uncultured organism TaxID=155900 RepID=Q6RWR0_9ZZZZ|nr:nitrilase [uncultured organism]
MAEPESFIVAAVQATPIFLDRQATLEKACDLIAEAGSNGAKLVLFPEAFIPTYPDWIWAVTGSQSALLDELYVELLENSVTIPDATTEQLCEAARNAGLYVVMGVNERNAEASNATLYNTLLYIDDQGKILGKHRKLVPTALERIVWGYGDGSTLDAFETPLGKIGGLICWENYMPLARQTLYAWGVQIYLAATWDRGEVWQATMRHIAREGGVYVVASCIPFHIKDIPDHMPEIRNLYAPGTDWINVGQSCIINPSGDYIAGPVECREEILYAEVNLRQSAAAKRMLDVAGHYGRPDVFHLTVNRTPNPHIR